MPERKKVRRGTAMSGSHIEEMRSSKKIGKRVAKKTKVRRKGGLRKKRTIGQRMAARRKIRRVARRVGRRLARRSRRVR